MPARTVIKQRIGYARKKKPLHEQEPIYIITIKHKVMTTISLKKAIIYNFKGIKELVIEFAKSTSIYGANATCKTSIVDAFRWVMFDKNSADETSFNVQPLDGSNKIISKVEVDVSIVLEVDFKEVTFRRVMKENWKTPRGTNVPVKDGNENVYYWNDVPMRLTDYKVKVAGVVSEDIFKLVTDPHYFNKIKWQARRQTLTEMAGEISDEAIAASKPKFAVLLRELESKDAAEYKRQIAASKKKLKDGLVAIPTRIDEAKRGTPQELNWSELVSTLSEKEASVAAIDASLLNESQAIAAGNDAIRGKQTRIHNLRSQLNTIEFGIRNAVQDKKQNRESKIQEEKRKFRGLNDEYTGNTTEYLNSQRRLEAIITEQAQLRGHWKIINEKAFEFDESELAQLRTEWAQVDASKLEYNDDDFCCPTCKRSFEDGDIATKKTELEANFNTKKSSRLAAINARAEQIKNEKETKAGQFTDNKAKQLQVIINRGTEIATEIQALEAKLANLKASNDSLTTSINLANQAINERETENARLIQAEATQVATDLQNHVEYNSVQANIKSLETEITQPEPSQVMNNLKSEKAVLVKEVDEVKAKLAIQDQIKSTNVRVIQLEAEQERLAQELAELEGKEFLMQEFAKAKITEVETRINGLFKYARFKMFDQAITINGGESECCETTYNGVPFSDLNTAAKMLVGIDIINALSKHYEVQAPIFLDNRESVITIPETEAQVINLIVSADDKKLRIAQQSEAVA